MADNMYGYTDYNGPAASRPPSPSASDRPNYDVQDDDDYDDDPLRSGLWMEGDSLAPPCGASLASVHAALDLAGVGPGDVLYDLGCGDGRVCLEAYWIYGAAECVGVEIEEDLIGRFEELIRGLPGGGRSTPAARGGGVGAGGGYGDGSVRSGRGDAGHRGSEGDGGSAAGGAAGPRDARPPVRAVRADLRDVLDALVARFAPGGDGETGGFGTSTDGDRWAEVRPELADLPRPTVIVLYLLPESVALIEPALARLMSALPDLRVACNSWGMKGLEPVKTLEVAEDGSGGGSTTLRLYAAV